MIHFFKSVGFAFSGLKHMIRKERNFQIQVICLILVIITSFYFNINSTDWINILLVSGLVLCLESINSALEKTCNLITTEIKPEIKIIKDIAAGAVWIASMIALSVAGLIFWKYY